MTILGRLLPQMAERGWGRVVAVQSSAVHEPISALQLSNAHRPGMVVGFKVLAKQFAGKGVTLNTLHPGRIATDRIIDMAGSREAAEEAARDQIPAGRLGEPADMGAAAAFLCSQQAAYITGISLLVDGGVTAGVYLVETPSGARSARSADALKAAGVLPPWCSGSTAPFHGVSGSSTLPGGIERWAAWDSNPEPRD